MLRATKIIATLGPASSDPEVLTQLIAAGTNAVRINFSHGSAEEHRGRLAMLRDCAAKLGKTVGVMGDLQGPKIRIGRFAGGKVALTADQLFILDPGCELGDTGRVGLAYPELVNDVVPGTVLLLDDGRVILDVEAVVEGCIHTRVRHAGPLSDKKGINRQGGGMSARALSEKDKEDIKLAASLKVDFLAVSFVKDARDVHQTRELLTAAGSDALIIAKIERVEAIENLAEIVAAADGIMVARGDLALEVGDAAVPALQKRMIKVALEMNKIAITATQMMDSMISQPMPTRAEVSDVANAVLDLTDAVMLSGETAAGKFPVQAVEAMARVCLEAEKSAEFRLEHSFLDRVFSRIDESIAMAALFTAYHLNCRSIAAMTQSGSTTLWMSRRYCGVPIYAITPEIRTRYKVSLFRGVYPLLLRYDSELDRDALLHRAEDELIRVGGAVHGDTVVITVGEPIGQAGGSNTMKIVKVGER